MKESEHFLIQIYWLNESNAIYFHFASKQNQSLVISFLYCKNSLNGKAMEAFQSTVELYNKLKEKDTELSLSSSAEVIMTYVPLPKAKKPFESKYQERIAAASIKNAL
jgi:hypothetical protein